MIAIAGTITIDPARRAGCLEAGAPLQRASREEEPGCLAYVFSADPLRDDVIQVFELWADAETLEAHFRHPNYTNMRALFGQWGISGASVAKHRIDASAPVYGPDGVASAAF